MKNNYTHFSILLLSVLFINSRITAQGFGNTAINWPLPPGGEKYGGINYSYHTLSDFISFTEDDGSNSWRTMDINGDARPDMVVYREKQNGMIQVYSPGNNPYWKVYLNTGTGFSQTAINWALPPGGEKYGNADYSFSDINHVANSADDNGSQAWVTMDMNGDNMVDILVYKEKQNGTFNVYSPGNNPYWKVYLNTGTGFSQTAVNWMLPPGGEKYGNIDYSFSNIFHVTNSADDNGSQAWNTMDMNGDNKVDILVYKEKQNGTYNIYSPGNNPYWKVYLNTGNGFSQTAINWALPPGGEKYNNTDYSFSNTYHTANSADDDGSQAWNTMDMDGDHKVDILVYKEKQNGTYNIYSPGNNPYWKVYLNTGNGFSQTAINWALPPGGEKYNNIDYSFGNTYHTANSADDNGSQAWNTMDMNGDSKADILIYNEKQNGIYGVYSPGNNPYWKVFFNTGSGFSQTTINWLLPPGGEKYNGTDYSFINTYGNSGSMHDDGSQTWTVIDMDGNNAIDLLVYREKQNGSNQVYSMTNNPYWKVFLNTTDVGFKDQKNNVEYVNAFPNPAKDKITITVEENFAGKNYTLSDNLGRIISSNKIQNKTTTIDISRLAPGIYFLNFNGYAGKSIKVVKE